jgi:hypothetical protein
MTAPNSISFKQVDISKQIHWTYKSTHTTNNKNW